LQLFGPEDSGPMCCNKGRRGKAAAGPAWGTKQKTGGSERSELAGFCFVGVLSQGMVFVDGFPELFKPALAVLLCSADIHVPGKGLYYPQVFTFI